MGSLFKVLGVSHPAITELAGLTDNPAPSEPSIAARTNVG
jgi:hypothetical protein